MEKMQTKHYTILSFEQLKSTQEYILSNLDNLSAGTVACAQTQTEGRGRINRRWQSAKGGLYFSVLLEPGLNAASNLQNLTQCISVALCKTLTAFGVTPQIKWPNDVLVHGQKIAGTLSNAVMHGDKISVVLGMGVNINQQAESFEGLNAVSLAGLTGQEYRINNFLELLLNEFFAAYNKLLEHGFEYIKADYMAFFANMGKPINIENGAAPLSGTVTGVNNKGELEVNLDDKIITVTIGDVTCLPNR